MEDQTKLCLPFRKTLPPHIEKIKNGHYTPDDEEYPMYLYIRENDITIEENGSEIVNFLKGKCILITGATGFLGTLLVEKLLRSCKDIKKVYVIIRAKKGKDFESRVKEYLNEEIFSRLSYMYPNFRDKIQGINGDFEQEKIGLSEESRETIRKEVNIIYHAAATIRFDEKLKKAVTINIKGTQEIIKLAKECKHLEVFTHISTAYSNSNQKEIREQFYNPSMDPDDLICIADKLTSEALDDLTPRLLGEMPNTYAYTKQIGEEVVRREAPGIPACIQRPSIVVSTVREPVRTYTSNIFGPVGLVAGTSIGLFHIMYGNPDGRADFVPADYVINNCIAASYKTAKDRLTNRVQIFNFTTSSENPFYWKNLRYASIQGAKTSSGKIIWKWFYSFTDNYYWYLYLHYALHIIPAYLFDFARKCLGQKPLLLPAYQKINKFVDVLQYYTLGEWSFQTHNTEALWDSLNEVDKKNFTFDMKSLNWKNYFNTYVMSLLEFILHDPIDMMEKTKDHRRRMNIIHYTFVSLIGGLSVYFFTKTIFFFVPVLIWAMIIYFWYTSIYQI